MERSRGPALLGALCAAIVACHGCRSRPVASGEPGPSRHGEAQPDEAATNDGRAAGGSGEATTASRAQPAAAGVAGGTRATSGPLRVLPGNGRYFADRAGRAVLLAGAHTWNDFQDLTERPFDYPAFLDLLASHHLNFFRLWIQENAVDKDTLHPISPLPYARTGPGNALDGGPRFDLTKFDPRYFDRLRNRIAAARDRGIYVSIMLFNGFQLGVRSSDARTNPWKTHPYNVHNNVNGINGDPDGDDYGRECHTSLVPAITRLQEGYVRQIVDAVADLDNVLYEISNESGAWSTSWQSRFIGFIHTYEGTKKVRHPVGMTFQYDPEKPGDTETLFASGAEWISPSQAAPNGFDYLLNPPPADGRKVLVADTDHICGICGDARWVWRSVTRGENLLYMDPYDGSVISGDRDLGVIDNMGRAVAQTQRMNLAAMVPRPDLSTTGYCLSDGRRELLVYAPTATPFTVDLTFAGGTRFDAEWTAVTSGRTTAAAAVPGGNRIPFKPPEAGAAVLYLRAQ